MDANYRNESFRKIMRDNAIKVFKLPAQGLATQPAEWAAQVGAKLAD